MLTSTTNVLKERKNTELSIQFSLDGFSFCIKDFNTNETLFFKEYIFSLKNPEELLKEIVNIFENDSHLQKDFDKVAVIHQNNLASIVPNNFFNDAYLKDYLKFSIKTLPNDFVTFDDIEIIKAKNVYIPYVNINNFLFQNFGEFEYKHHASVLIEKFIRINSENTKQVFININNNSFDIIVLENKQLILYNNFNYYTKEDFIYYVLFVTEQLNIDKEETPYFLTGKITKDSNLFEILYTYIRKISFFKSSNNIFQNLNTERHNHFILLG